jgi:hypothetical protein
MDNCIRLSGLIPRKSSNPPVQGIGSCLGRNVTQPVYLNGLDYQGFLDNYSIIGEFAKLANTLSPVAHLIIVLSITASSK